MTSNFVLFVLISLICYFLLRNYYYYDEDDAENGNNKIIPNELKDGLKINRMIFIVFFLFRFLSFSILSVTDDEKKEEVSTNKSELSNKVNEPVKLAPPLVTDPGKIRLKLYLTIVLRIISNKNNF